MYKAVASTIENNNNPYYHENLHKFIFNGEPSLLNITVESDKNIYHENILTSDNKKVIWSFHRTGLYHQFAENVSIFFDFYLKNKNKYDYVVLLVNKNFSYIQDNEKEYTNFIFKIFKDLNIKYYIYEIPTNNEYVYAKNFYTINTIPITKEMILNFKKIIFKYLKNKNVDPFRKIYLSRRHILPRNYDFLNDGLATKTDNRITDDLILESFLKELGFEIIIPEQKFKNFEDQIQYMYETKLLVSLTSSGLANMLFMQKNTTCIEFITSFPTPLNIDIDNINKKQDGEELLHLLYVVLSYLNNTTYMSINNYSRKSSDIIDSIINNKSFNFIFKDKND